MCSLECSPVNGYGYGSYSGYNDYVNQQRKNQFISFGYKDYQEIYKKNQKVGFWEGIKTIGKGLLKPLANIIEHPIKSIAMIGATTALIIGTGGAALPVLIGAGVALGGWQVGKGVYNAITSDTKYETLAALEDIGEGSFTFAASVYGAKVYMGTTAAGSATVAAANKTGYLAKAGTYIKGLGQDTLSTIKVVPSAAKQTATTLCSAEFINNLKPSVNAVKLDFANKKIQQMVSNGEQGTAKYNALIARRDQLATYIRDYGEGSLYKGLVNAKARLNPFNNTAETNLAIGFNSYVPDDGEVLANAAMLYPDGFDSVSRFV